MSMFEAPEGSDFSTLLQGDILTDVQFLGALNYGSIHHHVPATGGESTSWTVAKPPEFGVAMVLSHSCEVAKENGVKLTSIILAPMRDISGATPAGKLQELIASNLIDQLDDAGASYLKYFYLEAHEKLPQHAMGSVVDFSKCFSVRKNSYDFLLSKKVLQLNAAMRFSMSLKLALYFKRSETPSENAPAA
jgi:hypothetical protein